MPTVNFPAYREFDDFRIAASNSTEVMFLALRVARHELAQTPAALRDEYLPDIYKGAEVEAARVNLRLPDVISKMSDAETFLGYMQVTYTVAVLNEFLVVLTEMFQRDGAISSTFEPRDASLQKLRDKARQAAGPTDHDYKLLLDFIQRLRNDIAHGSGVATQKLIDRWADLTDRAKGIWLTITAGDATAPEPSFVVGQRVAVGAPESRAVLAVTRRVVVELNERCSQAISKRTWAEVAVDDYATRHPEAWHRFKDQRLKKVLGYAEQEYGPVGLGIADLSPIVSSHP